LSGATFEFTCRAMATAFGLRIISADPAWARDLAADAFRELERLEGELSRFMPDSDISRISRLTAGRRLRIGVGAYECLRIAAEVSAETGGAFDVTAQAGRPVTAGALEVDPDENAVTLRANGVRVDLGGIGKGYAVDAMVGVLERWGVEAALVQGGESTVRAIGLAPDGAPWRAALRDPAGGAESLATVALDARSLSGSGAALHGAHIIEPRTGRPASGHAAAWALADTAARADALSTAFMVMDDAQVAAFCVAHPQVGAAVLGGATPVRRFGRWT
jgi:thiamine biosynthesis lipoprotein